MASTGVIDVNLDAGPVVPDTTYYYKLCAVFNNGCPDACTDVLQVDVGCLAETIVAISAVPTIDPGVLDVSWNAPLAEPLAGYHILYGTTMGGPYPFFDDAAQGVYNTAIAGLTSGTPYYFIVESEDSAMCLSAPSNEVTGTPL